MPIRAGVVSSSGRKRHRNEDFYVVEPAFGLFLVIDGMGGHARGDLASHVVADSIRTFISQTANDRDKTWPFEFDPTLSFNSNRMRTAVVVADQELARRIAEDDQLRGMGATMAGALVDGENAVISNVGDCRAYLIRDGSIQQVTIDHSWVAEQVRSGLIEQADAKRHPLRNLVTRAVSGTGTPLDVELRELTLQVDDRLLLCSDGLHGLMTDDDLLQHVSEHPDDPQAACAALVEMAEGRGAPDNVTAMLLAVSS